MTWNDGYIVDACFPAFFYKEMQPIWLSFVANLEGFSAPDSDGSFTLCELGCGVGINLLVAAACHPNAHFVGVDFNPDHLRIAREAASSSALTNIEFIHADFTNFARTNTQTFDYVTCHGVWSWIAPHNRTALLDSVTNSLKHGGLFYLHYMSHPGSTDLKPLQHLMNLCAHHMPGPSERKAQVGLKLLQQLASGGAFSHHPAMTQHLANMAKREASDLAHEFLTDNWEPQHSIDVHQHVGDAGLSYLASADVFNNLDTSLSIPGKLQNLISQTRVPALAETLKDIARNSHQRMDLFQKTPKAPDPSSAVRRLQAISFQLLPSAPPQGPLRIQTPIGPVELPSVASTRLLECLADGPKSGAFLLNLPHFKDDEYGLIQSIQLLMVAGLIHPSLSHAPDAHKRGEALTRCLQQAGIALEVRANTGSAVFAHLFSADRLIERERIVKRKKAG